MLGKIWRGLTKVLFVIGVIAGVLVTLVILLLIFAAPDDDRRPRAKKYPPLKDAMVLQLP